MKYLNKFLRRNNKATVIEPVNIIESVIEPVKVVENSIQDREEVPDTLETHSRSSSLNVEFNEEIHLLNNKVSELEDSIKRLSDRNNRLHRSLLIHSDNTTENFSVSRRIILLFSFTLIVNQIIMIYTLRKI